MNQLVLCVKLLVAALPVAVGFIDGLLFGLPVLLIQIVSAIQETQERVLTKHTRARPLCNKRGNWSTATWNALWGIPGCQWKKGWPHPLLICLPGSLRSYHPLHYLGQALFSAANQITSLVNFASCRQYQRFYFLPSYAEKVQSLLFSILSPF